MDGAAKVKRWGPRVGVGVVVVMVGGGGRGGVRRMSSVHKPSQAGTEGGEIGTAYNHVLVSYGCAWMWMFAVWMCIVWMCVV